MTQFSMDMMSRVVQIDEKLVCTEPLDTSLLAESPSTTTATTTATTRATTRATARATATAPSRSAYPSLPATVSALEDSVQLGDDRVLQNLLRNECKYLPMREDYMSQVQNSSLSSCMRKIVTDWMLEVVHEQSCSPDVFCLAVNIMDRFLALIRIHKSQLQLLGSVSLLVASKIREPFPIPGATLVAYTDFSVDAEQLKEWELLVLHTLQWEVCSITPIDYLPHMLPRIGLDLNQSEMAELRRRTETILALCATNYNFVYSAPSLMAASALMLALNTWHCTPRLRDRGDEEQVWKLIRLRIQTVTHTETEHVAKCSAAIDAVLPDYLRELKRRTTPPPSPDSTSSPKSATLPRSSELISSPELMSTKSPEFEEKASPELISEKTGALSHLMCDEKLSNDDSWWSSQSRDSLGEGFDSRSCSPISAVDIFADFSSNVLQGDDANVEGMASIWVS